MASRRERIRIKSLQLYYPVNATVYSGFLTLSYVEPGEHQISGLCSRCPDEFGCVPAGSRREGLAAEHASDLFGAAGGIELGDLGYRTALFFGLTDPVVVVCKTGNLGQVGNAENLILGGKRLQAARHALRGT